MESAWHILGSPLLYAALAAGVFVPLELLLPLRATQRSRASLKTDLGFATLGAVLTSAIVLLGAGTGLGWLSMEHEGPLATITPLISLPLGLLVFELGGYAYHRAAHAIPALWRLHEPHHSATDMDYLSGFRQHPVEIGLMTLAQNLPLVLLGLPLGEHALIVLALQLNTLFVHSNLQTPRLLQGIIATPRFHHRHHAATLPAANFATLFPWLDRVFGTWAPAAPDARHGLPGRPSHTPTFFELLAAPFVLSRRAARRSASTAGSEARPPVSLASSRKESSSTPANGLTARARD